MQKVSQKILKQRLRSEKHNVFTEEVNKIALSPNNNKRTQSNRFNRKICIKNKWRNNTQKKEIQFLNIIKQYEKWLTMTILQKKHKWS